MLAMLYMARGEQEKAKKAVDFGLKTLEYRASIAATSSRCCAAAEQ